ncbi:MAG: hypothetical protein AAF598_04555 [Bacteroidota bacterium]
MNLTTNFHLAIRLVGFAALFSLFGTSLLAQQDYSYVSDRKFKSPSDLIGYTFSPNEIGFPDGSKLDLEKGEISLSIGANYLTISGSEYEGAYSINAIKAESYGYYMALVDARDPAKQGNLKFHLNKYGELDVLVFKPSDKEEQVVFFQALMSKNKDAREAAYFTDRDEYKLEDPDEIWGDTIKPFHQLAEGRQYRIQPQDSIAFTFQVDTIGEGKKQKIGYTAKLHRMVEIEEDVKELQVETFVIKNIQVRQSQNPREVDRRFQVAYQSKNAPGGAIWLYLNEQRKVSAIELGNMRFLVRGY